MEARSATGVLIANRYRLGERLGAGGMGAVFRAYDRLTRQDVALKQIIIVGDPHQNTEEHAELRLGLALEFRTLATLRHPNIIDVVDYGFDQRRLPYFTMTLLPGAQTMTRFAEDLNLRDKAQLLIEMLQALTYVHRRGVIHRDLKPSNVLVTEDGQVKVLDFGVASVSGQSTSSFKDTIVGTMAYMAPELFMEEPASPASDMYAVGVIAFEMFAGRLPLDVSNFAIFIRNVLTLEPDWSLIDPAMRPIVQRLLAKSPHERPTAEETITAIAAAADYQPAADGPFFRDSVLHFTRFVGRRVEVSRLKTALRDLADGHGSAWLITGESGVGKTRLLEEVRIRAAVTGVLTLRGQAVASGGLPYQLWREPLRRLLLHIDLSDAEASVLLEIVADIADLIGRDVRPAPPLDAQPQQKRLLTTILDLFRRIESPVLMIAEDVQWSVESLEVLRLLRPLTGQVPLMLVASYRDEERPKLADDLGFGNAPHAENVIRLARLSDEEVAEMSASMLGDSGRDPEVLSLLRRETEGNAYFITEVVRALVEDAGGITQIGALTLPQHVISGGIRQVINARLRRAPEDARELLILAAAAGREPDLRVLGALRGPVDLDTWLIDCANAAILEFQDGIWRFTHDKLRDALLHGAFPELEASLPVTEAHRRVAQAIEQVYADDLAPHYDDLAFHYHRADDRNGERRFVLLAAEQAANRYSNIDAVHHFSRAWELVSPDNPALQFQILSGREKAYGLLGQRESQRRDLDMMLALADKLSDRERARAQLREAEWFYNSGDQVNSRQAGERALALAQAANDLELVTIAHNALGQAHWRSADYDSARNHYRQALDLEQRLDQPRIRAVALNGLGIVADLTGDRAASYAHFTAALEIFRQLNSIVQIASSLTNLGIALWRQGKLGEALDVMLESLSLRERSHDRAGEAYLLGNISIVYKALGQYEQALEHVYRGIDLARELKNRYTEGRLLLNAGSHQIEMRQFRLAEDLLKDAAAVSQASSDRQNLAFCFGQLARLTLLQGDFEAAHSWIDQNLELSLAIGDRDSELGGRLMRAMIARLEGEPAQALGLMQACVEVQRAMQPDGRTTDDLLIPLAHTRLELGRDDEAWEAYNEAVRYAEIGGARRNAEVEAGMALLALKRGDQADALERINVLLPMLMDDMLYGPNEIVLAFVRAAHVLEGLNDERLTPLVMRAYEVFQAILTEASSDLHRRWMVERIPVNAALIDLWQRLNQPES